MRHTSWTSVYSNWDSEQCNPQRIVFGVCVAIGVIGESVTGFLHWRRSGQLQRIQATEILTLQGAIADANARALEAQEALEKYKAPRKLSPEQQAAITEQMRPYAGTVFTMGAFNDTEPIDLMQQIDRALLDAGWKETEWKSGGNLALSRPGHPNFGYVVLAGVYAQADRSHAENFGPIVARLAAGSFTSSWL
jgi:hypothetical protein